LEYLLEAAQLAKKATLQIKFKVMGEGFELERIKQLSKSMLLENLEFYEYAPKQKVKEHLDESQAIFITYKDIPILSTGSPNKLFDGLAAGKLIITNFDGWIKTLIEDHQCGFSYPADKPSIFIEKIKPFTSDSKLLLEYQGNARSLAEREFSKEGIINRLNNFLVE